MKKIMQQQKFYEKPGYWTCWYEAELNLIVEAWDDVTWGSSGVVEAYQQTLEVCLQAVIRHRADKWLANTMNIKRAIPQEVHEWIQQVFVPRVVQEGLKYHATVLSQKAMGRLTVQSALQPISVLTDNQLTMANFATEQEARAWLHQQA